MTWGELRDLTARIADRPALPRRRSRRPRRRLHPQHPRGDRGVPGVRVDRRDVVVVLAGLRRALGRRPLRADRAQGADRRRRLPLRRQGLRPPRRRRRAARRDPVAGARRAAGLPRRRAETRPRACSAWRELIKPAGAAGVRPAALRPPAVGAVLLGHDRAAQGDRPRPGRHAAGAPQEDALASRRPGGRPRLLVHHHRVDDVELPRRRAADAGVDRPLRRQPGHAVPRTACGISPRSRRPRPSGRARASSPRA